MPIDEYFRRNGRQFWAGWYDPDNEPEADNPKPKHTRSDPSEYDRLCEHIDRAQRKQETIG